jgi:L-ascorbate metabolism protein UlaG (beta-lactamase superfamily)
LSLTYLGHSAVLFQVNDLTIYVDPYFKDPVDWTTLPKADLVILTHGHFDHGVLMSVPLYEAWKCSFLAPRTLIQWMQRKYKRKIPNDAFIPIAHGETIQYKGLAITAVPAHHPVNRMGKTILRLFARSSAPGKPVNGYFFSGYYHAGDTIYTAAIPAALENLQVDTACLPIGGKYGVASPAEALKIAEQIGASRVVPLHWQALVEQVPFRYQSSDLVKLAKDSGTKVSIFPLAIGERLEPMTVGDTSILNPNSNMRS